MRRALALPETDRSRRHLGIGAARPAAALTRAVSTGGALVIVAAALIARAPERAAAAALLPAEPNGDCTLIVPDQPLTARGLATPYQLTATNPRDGRCHESNPAQAAFVQGAVLDLVTGHIAIYNPLVSDRGAAPAIAPIAPVLPAGALVALWFGFNGAVLRLRGARPGTLDAAQCVNGRGGSPFGQFAYCNAVAFFAAANGLIRAGQLTPPAVGTGQDGLACPTVRDYSVVDQDPSDNVTTAYLVTPGGRTAQDTAANAAELSSAEPVTNGSDNRLLAIALDAALGCTPWMAPDLADDGAPATALPLDELQAAADQAAPVATVPQLDPMALVSGKPSLAKLNLYRAGVDQAPVASDEQARDDMRTYCVDLRQVAPPRLRLDRALTSARPSPTPALASSLFTFLAQRFVATYGEQGLNCADLLRLPDPIKLAREERGIAVGATIGN